MRYGKFFKCTFTVAFLWFGLIGPSFAQNTTISRLLEVSGIGEQITLLPNQLRAGMEQGLKSAPMSDQARDSFFNAVDTHLEASGILEGIELALQRELSPSETTALLKWFDSDLGMRLIDLDRQASTPEAAQAAMQGAQELLEDEPRRDFAMQLDAVRRQTDRTIELIVVTQSAVYLSISRILNPGEVADPNMVRTQLAASAEDARPQLQRSVEAAMIYAYRDVEMEQLERYLAFLQTPAAAQFYQVVHESLSAELQTRFAKVGESLGAGVDTAGEADASSTELPAASTE